MMIFSSACRLYAGHGGHSDKYCSHSPYFYVVWNLGKWPKWNVYIECVIMSMMSIIWSKLYGTTVYVAKACNLYRIGSKEGTEILERQNLCEDSATGGQMAYLTYLKYRILKSFIGKNLCRNYAFKCISSVTKFGYFLFF